MNQVAIIGRLTRDPILRHTSKGTSFTSFGLARNERYGETDRVLFVDVTCWGRLAEIGVEHKSKGDQVGVTGRLELDEYETNTGEKKSQIRIVAAQIEFLAKPNGKHTEPHAPLGEAAEEALPF